MHICEAEKHMNSWCIAWHKKSLCCTGVILTSRCGPQQFEQWSAYPSECFRLVHLHLVVPQAPTQSQMCSATYKNDSATQNCWTFVQKRACVVSTLTTFSLTNQTSFFVASKVRTPFCLKLLPASLQLLIQCRSDSTDTQLTRIRHCSHHVVEDKERLCLCLHNLHSQQYHMWREALGRETQGVKPKHHLGTFNPKKPWTPHIGWEIKGHTGSLLIGRDVLF